MTLAVFQEKGQILTKYLYSDTSREKKENFQDTKRTIRIRNWNKDRHCNGQKGKYKRTNNGCYYST